MQKSKFVKKCRKGCALSKHQDGGPLESQYSQLGSSAGSLLGTLGNVAMPGLGQVLSPLLGGLGSIIGSKLGAPKDITNQLNQLTVNKNPYGLQDGGPLVGDKEKAWIATWLASAEAKKRASEFGISEDLVASAAESMWNTPVNFYPKDAKDIASGGEYNPKKYPLGLYNPTAREVQMFVTPSSISSVPKRKAEEFYSTILHELAHSTNIDLIMQQYAPQAKEMQSYFNSGEAWPRIMEIRYNLNLQPGQKVEQHHIDEAKKIMPNNLIFKAYDDTDIIHMMNTFVSIPLNAADLQIAKYGGALTGRQDAAVYKGRLHNTGGILVNSKGVPSGKPDAEVEGGEVKVTIGGKEYIFSSRLSV